MTNLFLVMLTVTNWIDTGDFKRIDGTNYIRQRMLIETNIYTFEVTLCTNRFLIKSTDSGTNGPIVWRIRPTPMMSLPPARTKE